MSPKRRQKEGHMTQEGSLSLKVYLASKEDADKVHQNCNVVSQDFGSFLISNTESAIQEVEKSQDDNYYPVTLEISFVNDNCEYIPGETSTRHYPGSSAYISGMISKYDIADIIVDTIEKSFKIDIIDQEIIKYESTSEDKLLEDYESYDLLEFEYCD